MILQATVGSVAALYDIHGNMCALRAVLRELELQPPDCVVIGGDIAWGPEPAAAIGAVRRLPWPTLFVRGNTDREIAAGLDGDIWRWCRERLSREQLDFLGGLPLRVTVDVAGLGAVLFVHGSPRDDNEPLRGNTPDDQVAAALVEVRAPVVVCGHTHIQFDRRVAGLRVVNAGSVGLQSCAYGACWAWIEGGVHLRETAYDPTVQAAVVRASGMPRAAELAAHLLRPPMVPPGRFVP